MNASENLNSYKISSPKSRHNRKLFYSLHRKYAEPMEKWLKRIEKRINRCDFGKFANFFLLDKFFSELDKEEMGVIESEQQTWTIDQLRQYFWTKNVNTE